MLHEDLQRAHAVEVSSERSFGFVFAAVFALVAAWPLPSGGGVRLWAAVLAGVFVGLALLVPGVLAAPNRAWARLGLLLGRIVSPIALGLLFYGVVWPVGVAMRLAGKDVLRLARDPSARSYWIARDPPGPPPGSMGQQF